MTNVPEVSVIMACYNASKYMEETIESVLNQTFADFEFVIVDDFSTDDSLEIAQRYQQMDARVMVVSLPKNSGAAAARNAAVEKARGRLICVIDADDICRPYRLQVQHDFLLNNPASVLVSGAMEYIDESGDGVGRTYPITDTKKIRKKY